MKNYFSADWHLSHKNIIGYDNRPFRDIYEMNQKIIENYLDIVTPKDNFYFLGDFCFNNKQVEEFLSALHGNLFFIRGNHDNPKVCRVHPNYIADFIFKDNMFFVSGAFSIDRMRRTENLDWWSEEELSSDDLYKMIDLYEKVKPNIMVTHCFPMSIQQMIFNFDPPYPNRTSQALDGCLSIHKPKIWICGHYHQSKALIIDGTRFICLNELEYKDIDLNQYI